MTLQTSPHGFYFTAWTGEISQTFTTREAAYWARFRDELEWNGP